MFSIESWLADIPTELVVWLSGLSILTFLGSLVAVPIIIARLPADYFEERQRHEAKLHQVHPLIYLVVRVLKNALGAILVVGGILMLVLPGQGILTILIGIGLSDFPGKYQLERRLVQLPGVLTAINWVRAKAGAPPLRV